MNRSPGFLAALAVLASALLAAAPALAQEPDGTRSGRLYLNPSVLVGSGRVVSLGGAYVGIAEGAAGFSSNLASLAQRNPTLDRDWDLDVLASILTAPRKTFDLDNDGDPDDQYLSNTNVLLGLMLQYKNYGLGAYTRFARIDFCANASNPCSDPLTVTVGNSALAGAIGFGDDEFLAALGLYMASGKFEYQGHSWDYAGTGFAVDVLYRPRNRPYRIGLSVKPQVIAPYRPQAGQSPSVAGHTLFAAVVSPALVSVGTSVLLGPGAERYNRLSPAARRQAIEEAEGHRIIAEPPAEPPPVGTVLVTAQVDLLSGVEGAVPLGAFLSAEPPPTIGESLYLVPRVGAEYEPWRGRLRGRLGAYLEPSPFPDRPYRPHMTAGFELFVLHYIQDWELSGTFDIAPLYSNIGISVGFWH